jgi:uracil phosphoribosyltransferase
MERSFPNLTIVQHPLIKRDLTEIRDESTKQEQFRNAVSRISVILAAEIMKNAPLLEITVKTPLEKTTGHVLRDGIILVPVLRAGLGMTSGFISLIPDARVGHVGIQRNESTLQPDVYYSKSPKTLNSSITIMLDPMLATGGSASAALSYLKERGAVKLFFACLVASPTGVQRLQDEHPDVPIYAAVLDRELNEKGYILPGLGDAGDRTFGTL